MSSSLLTASCLAHAHQLHAPCAIVTFLKQQTRATYCYYSLAFLLLTKWFMLSLPSRLSMVHIEDVVYNCFATLSDADIVFFYLCTRVFLHFNTLIGVLQLDCNGISYTQYMENGIRISFFVLFFMKCT